MSTIKIHNKRQLTIPKIIFDDLGLKEGDYVEITRRQDFIMIKPKKIEEIQQVEQENKWIESKQKLAEAAKILMTDYMTDDELTAFRSLDGEDFHV
jgi:AbrB family looped-hinge helix DNA binding protein